MIINIIQHVHFEDPGYIKNWADNNFHKIITTHVHKGEQFPANHDFDAIIVLGGPMGVNDNKSWISREKEFLRETVLSGKKILGICLGAQLLASVLGADVYPGNYREIGWFNIRITEQGRKSVLFRELPNTVKAFHWHGDTFDIPDNAERIFESEACKNQGFIIENRILGLQFHLEIMQKGVENLIYNCSDEMVRGRYIQSKKMMKESLSEKVHNANGLMEKILNEFLNSII